MRETEKNPAVYVVLLNWNNWQDTLACVHSLRAMHNQDYSIIIIDNASANDSVAQLRDRLPDIEIIRNESNLGFSGGCNKGIKQALYRGAEYVWLLNNDAVVDKDTLDALLNKMNDCENAAIVGAQIYDMDKRDILQTWGGGKINLFAGLAWHMPRRGVIDYISGACMLIPSRVIRNVGLFDDNYFMYWEDADYSIRAREAGYAITVAEDAKIFHKQSSRHRNEERKTRYMTESSIRFFGTHSALPVLSIFIGNSYRALSSFIKGRFLVSRTIISQTITSFLKC